jgi:hypothetical protein
MMRIGGGDVKESSVVVVRSGLLQVVSGVFALFPSRAGTGELPSNSNRSSWAWEKWRMSAVHHERERGSKMAEGFDRKRPPRPPFFSV